MSSSDQEVLVRVRHCLVCSRFDTAKQMLKEFINLKRSTETSSESKKLIAKAESQLAEEYFESARQTLLVLLESKQPNSKPNANGNGIGVS